MYAFILVGLGGAIGSMARFGVSKLIPIGSFPVATLTVNVVGSLLMGILIGALAKWASGWGDGARLFLAVGVLGGFTTFSAFSLDSIVLIERGQWVAAFGYVFVSVLASLAAIGVGLLLMRGVA